MINRTGNILRVRELSTNNVDYIIHAYFSFAIKIHDNITFITSPKAIHISNGNSMFHSNIFRVNFYKKVLGKWYG